MNTLVKKFLLLISIIILFNSCAAINVTTSSAKEKGIKEAISDGMIDAAINKEFLNHDINMFINVVEFCKTVLDPEDIHYEEIKVARV